MYSSNVVSNVGLLVGEVVSGTIGTAEGNVVVVGELNTKNVTSNLGGAIGSFAGTMTNVLSFVNVGQEQMGESVGTFIGANNGSIVNSQFVQTTMMQQSSDTNFNDKILSISSFLSDSTLGTVRDNWNKYFVRRSLLPSGDDGSHENPFRITTYRQLPLMLAYKWAYFELDNIRGGSTTICRLQYKTVGEQNVYGLLADGSGEWIAYPDTKDAWVSLKAKYKILIPITYVIDQVVPSENPEETPENA